MHPTLTYPDQTLLSPKRGRNAATDNSKHGHLPQDLTSSSGGVLNQTWEWMKMQLLIIIYADTILQTLTYKHKYTHIHTHTHTHMYFSISFIMRVELVNKVSWVFIQSTFLLKCLCYTLKLPSTWLSAVSFYFLEFKFYFILEYSWCTILCYFHVYSKVFQLYIWLLCLT